MCQGGGRIRRTLWDRDPEPSLSGQGGTTRPFLVLRSRTAARVLAADWEPVLQRPQCPWGCSHGLYSAPAQPPADGSGRGFGDMSM